MTRKQKLLRLDEDILEAVQELKDANESDNAVYTRIIKAGISSLTGTNDAPVCEAVRDDISPEDEQPVKEDDARAIEAYSIATGTLQGYVDTLKEQLNIKDDQLKDMSGQLKSKDDQLAKMDEQLTRALDMAQLHSVAITTTTAAPLSERLSFLFTGKR